MPLGVSWSPDGTRLAFYAAEHEMAADPANWELELLTVSLDGRCMKLADKCYRARNFGAAIEFGPQWSPDGRTIYFVANYEHPRDREAPALTYSIAPTGGVPVKMCPGTPTAVTPDGRHLYASGRLRNGEAINLRVDLRTGEQTRLGEDWRHARVSLSGRYVACFPLGGGINIFSVEGQPLATIKPEALYGVVSTNTVWVMQERQATEDSVGGSPQSSSDTTSNGSTRRPWIVLVLMLAIIAALVAIWCLRRGRTPSTP
mgnify:FL=1